jgi:hypothetical protein
MTQEQLAEAMSLKAQGLETKYIAERLGYAVKTVADQLRQALMGDAERQRWRDRKNARRRAKREATRDGRCIEENSISPRAPEWVVADRDRRLSRPYDIRVDFLGEPEPGRSALDRKLAEHRV